MQKLSWKTCFKIGLSVFVLYLAIHYWPSISGAFGTVLSAATPLIAGFAMAYPVNILMSFFERHYFPKCTKKAVVRLKKPVCLIGAMVTLAGLLALVIGLVAPQLVNCVKMIIEVTPGFIQKLIVKLEDFAFISDEIINTLSSIDWKSKLGDIAQTLTSGLGSVMDVAVSAVSSVFSVVTNAVIGFIFALYLLMSKEKLFVQCGKVAKKYIPWRIYEKVKYVLSVTNDCFRRFIVGQCTEAVILGTLCMIGMLALQLPYAPMIGALVAFTALIPIVGAFIGAGVGAFLILLQSPVKALIFLVFIVVLQQIEGNLIYPKVVGSSMGLPGLWVLAAVTIGGGVMGIWGMLIGVPVAAVIYKLISNDVNAEKEAAVLADGSPLPEPTEPEQTEETE